MKAYFFPKKRAQFAGMDKELNENFDREKAIIVGKELKNQLLKIIDSIEIRLRFD